MNITTILNDDVARSMMDNVVNPILIAGTTITVRFIKTDILRIKHKLYAVAILRGQPDKHVLVRIGQTVIDQLNMMSNNLGYDIRDSDYGHDVELTYTERHEGILTSSWRLVDAGQTSTIGGEHARGSLVKRLGKPTGLCLSPNMPDSREGTIEFVPVKLGLPVEERPMDCLKSVANHSGYNNLLVNSVVDRVAEGHKILMPLFLLSHVYHVRDLLASKGVAVDVITSRTGIEERISILDRVGGGLVDVVVCVNSIAYDLATAASWTSFYIWLHQTTCAKSRKLLLSPNLELAQVKCFVPYELRAVASRIHSILSKVEERRIVQRSLGQLVDAIFDHHGIDLRDEIGGQGEREHTANPS
jgi:hypothetical protein